MGSRPADVKAFLLSSFAVKVFWGQTVTSIPRAAAGVVELVPQDTARLPGPGGL